MTDLRSNLSIIMVTINEFNIPIVYYIVYCILYPSCYIKENPNHRLNKFPFL